MATDENAAQELSHTLDFCLRVGEVLLSNGAGAADVTVTMRALARHFGLRAPQVDVTFTSLSMSALRQDDETAVVIRQVTQREIDYEDLTNVNTLVGEVLAGKLDLTEARRELGRIVSTGHLRPRWHVTLSWGLMCAAFGVQLGGDWVVMLIAAIAAMAIDRLQLGLGRRRLPYFYQQVGGAALATLIVVATYGLGVNLDTSLVITTSIIMLLAGIGFMGALQDALSGFYITANARLLEAVLATAGIIAGVGAGLSIAGLLNVDLGTIVPGRFDLTSLTMSAIGAAIGAAAFAYASYSPRRALLPVAFIAGTAMIVYQLILSQDVNRAWPAGMAAFYVGLVSFGIAGRVQVPPLVVVVPAIVPMLPGLSIYRGLSLLAAGGSGTTLGLLAMFGAASIAMALAAGVILGEYVAQPVKREARRLESRLAGPRLVGPSRIRHSRSERRQKE